MQTNTRTMLSALTKESDRFDNSSKIVQKFFDAIDRAKKCRKCFTSSLRHFFTPNNVMVKFLGFHHLQIILASAPSRTKPLVHKLDNNIILFVNYSRVRACGRYANIPRKLVNTTLIKV